MTISRLILYYGIVMIQICAIASEKKNPNTMATKAIQSGGAIIGVATVAGVTSKDGKVSSTGGVKIYPPPGSKEKNSDPMKPWIFSKKTDNGVVVGAVQTYPGSVVASAVSYGQKGDFGQINTIPWPGSNDFFPQKLPPVLRRNPFLTNNYMFKDFDPMIPDLGDSSWFRPIYDPFVNLW